MFCTDQQLQTAFSPFGEVVEAKIMRCEETHKHLCYGFVKFSTHESALKAMDSLNTKLLCGRPMRLNDSRFALTLSIVDSYNVILLM